MTTCHNTLETLLAAIKSGEVDLSKCGPLMIDNDCAWMSLKGVDAEDNPFEEVEVFHAHPADLLAEAINLLGIPSEYV